MFAYHRPGTLEEALSILNRASGGALPYAGGTDLLPRFSRGLMQPPGAIVDLKGIEELKKVSPNNGEVSLGACASMSEIAANPTIRSAAPVLAEAAGRIACPQIRNRATLGGNLSNASPAADTAIPLILLDAVLELARLDGGSVAFREVPIDGFFSGPGSTVLNPGELLVRIRFKSLPEETFAAWDKFGTRPSMEIAVATVGVLVKFQDGEITSARVGYGSVAPIPLRGKNVEAVLEGRPLTAQVIKEAEATAREEITPITDVRASEPYRREVVGVMLRRMLERAKSGSKG